MAKSCPLGHTCDECHWFIQLQGLNPQTGLPMDKYMCAIVAIPLLTVQTAGKTDQVAAAVESARNAFLDGTERLGVALSAPREARLIGGSTAN